MVIGFSEGVAIGLRPSRSKAVGSVIEIWRLSEEARDEGTEAVFGSFLTPPGAGCMGVS